MREREERKRKGPKSPNRARQRSRIFGHLCLALGLLFVFTSSLPSIALAALGIITLDAIQTFDHDGTPGNGIVDFGDLRPGLPVTVAPAVSLTVSSDLEWRLKAWTAALPVGVSLEEAPHGTGSFTSLSSSAVIVRDAEAPCSMTTVSDDMRLAVSWSTPPGSYSVQVFYEVSFTDETPPSGTVVINGGELYTASPEVLLDLSAVDDSGTVDAITISSDGVGWLAWQAYSTSLAYALPGPDGPNTVWVMFRDRAGNESAPVSDSIILDRVEPAISGVAVANITASSADVTWTTDEDASSQVDFGTDNGYGSSATTPGYSTGHAVALTGLTPGTLYHYRALSADPAGNVGASGDQTFWTLCEAPVLSVSLARTGSSHQYEATLTWTASLNAASYTVYREDLLTATVTSWSVTGTSYVDAFDAPQDFRYWVAAVNGNADESPSNSVRVTTEPYDNTPPVLTITSVTPGQTQCVITWTTDEPATSSVMWGLAGSGTFTSTPVDSNLINDHSVTVIGLNPSTSYDFYAVSTDASGNTGQSATGQFTTMPTGVPPSPGNLRVVKVWPNYQFVGLAWDTAETAIEYVVYQRDAIDPEATWFEAGRTTDATLTVGFSNPNDPSYSYDYCVTAINALGESTPSNVVNVTKP